MSKFLSNMAKVSSSTLVGQLIGLVVTPILARIYSPADFGIFQLFVSIVGVIAPTACLSYYYAIILPEKNEDSANVVILCLFLIAMISFITTIFFFLFSNIIEHDLNAPGFSHYVPLIPLAILFSGYAYIFGYWASRKEQYGIIAKANVYSSFTGKGFSIGYGLLGPTPFGLIVGSIINDVTIVLILIKKAIEDFSLFYHTSYEKIKEMVIRYKKFPQYSLGADLAGTIAIQVIPFALAFNFSPDIIGYYAMAYIILRLPTRLIGNAIGTVFFQQASVEKNHTGEIRAVVKSVYTRLISFGIFICLILIIAGPEIFAFVFGSRWETAGLYAQILAPSFFVAFIAFPLAYIYPVLEKQSISFWFNISLFFSSVFVLIIGGLMHSPIISMILLSATGTLFWGWMNLYSLKIAGVPWVEAGYELVRHFILGLIVCLPLLIAMFLSFKPVIIIALIVIVSVVYYLIIVYQDTSLRNGLLNFVREIINR
jgi:lipopolysaccharide exporter